MNNRGDLPASAEEPEVFELWMVHTPSSEPIYIVAEVNGVVLDMELDTSATVQHR